MAHEDYEGLAYTIIRELWERHGIELYQWIDGRIVLDPDNPGGQLRVNGYWKRVRDSYGAEYIAMILAQEGCRPNA